MKLPLQIAQAMLAFLFLVAPLAPAVRAADPVAAPRNKVKVLTIGNSFADNSIRFLPAMAKSAGKSITLFRANLGGHSFQQHASYVDAFEANPDAPEGRPYYVNPMNESYGRGISLREALQSDQWDVVTVQQVSQLSPKYETFQPYANQVIAYVRKYAPQAEIFIQETWAYPSDCSRYQDPNLSYLKDPETMYQNVKISYGKLAADTGLKMIRVGDAFHTILTSGNPIRLHGVNKDNTGDIHANATGEFLGAAMFYEAFFRDSILNNTYVPENVTPENAKRLREVAHSLPTQAAVK